MVRVIAVARLRLAGNGDDHGLHSVFSVYHTFRTFEHVLIFPQAHVPIVCADATIGLVSHANKTVGTRPWTWFMYHMQNGGDQQKQTKLIIV